MSYRSISDFLEELDRDGELVRIAAEVDPELEIAEITDRASADGGPALLFQRVKGSEMAVLTNLLGTPERVCRGLGIERLDQIAERLRVESSSQGTRSWFERLIGSAGQTPLDSFHPKAAKTGPCQQVVKLAGDVDLMALPALRCRPREEGRWLTAGVVITRNPESGELSMARHPIQILDKNRAAILWDSLSATARNYEQHRAQGERMPLVVALGGHPVYSILGETPALGGVDAAVLGGLLRAAPLELVACRTLDLRAPGDAEIVIEGYCDPTEPHETAGPFATEAGYYSLPVQAPVFHVTAITQRAHPLLPALVLGPSSGEQASLRKAVERLLVPLARTVIPELVDLGLPGRGGRGDFAFVAIRKSFPGQGRKVASALWGWEPLMGTKFIVIVDDWVNVHDQIEVWRQVGANVQPGRDVFVQPGPSSGFDHATPVIGLGEKLALDATAKMSQEHPREWPQPAAMSEEVRAAVARRWEELGIELSPSMK